MTPNVGGDTAVYVPQARALIEKWALYFMGPDVADLFLKAMHDRRRYLEGFEAPPVVEDQFVEEMCPNCLTPWKCNGPHLTGEQMKEAA